MKETVCYLVVWTSQDETITAAELAQITKIIIIIIITIIIGAVSFYAQIDPYFANISTTLKARLIKFSAYLFHKHIDILTKFHCCSIRETRFFM